MILCICILSLTIAYFSLSWIEICIEQPRNPKDNLQYVFMQRVESFTVTELIFLPKQRLFPFLILSPLVFTFLEPKFVSM